MLQVHFLDTDFFQFTAADRAVILRTAAEGEALVRRYLPLADHLHLLVEGSADVLETGDNAYTLAPHAIRWWADPGRGVATVASHHLIKAFGHEAFHAARFRQLGPEAGSRSWTVIAIGEGLATVFAREVTGANEPWGIYDPTVIQSWTEELFHQPYDSPSVEDWRFRHPDGREWICYRVGTWIVDRVLEVTGGTPVELLWTPAAEIAAMIPVLNRPESRP